MFEDNNSSTSSSVNRNHCLLQSLEHLYPTEDLFFLEETIQKYKDPDKIQEYLEKNHTAASKRVRMQKLQHQQLKLCCKSEQNLWQCPGCGYWKKISRRPVPISVTCDEAISCGSFCYKCKKKSHAPFECRQNFLIKNMNFLDDPNKIFKKISAAATEESASYRKFKLPFSENLTFDMESPLANLCKIALGKIPQMLRRRVMEINYYENDDLTLRFYLCKEDFERCSIPTEELLLCHGTEPENVQPIMEEGFLLSMCKRFVHGFGIYFADEAERSKCHGGRNSLLLCRVLTGTPYISNVQGENIPDGFHSKIVSQYTENCVKSIIINKEYQILPAFEVVFHQSRYQPLNLHSNRRIWDLDSKTIITEGVISSSMMTLSGALDLTIKDERIATNQAIVNKKDTFKIDNDTKSEKTSSKIENGLEEHTDCPSPKRIKVDNAPKEPLGCAYFLFVQDERPKVIAENPDYNIIELAKELGKRWAEIDPAVKQRYQQMAEVERQK